MSKQIDLSIHLCPEFGWNNTTSSEPIDTSKAMFGPGSVLKGFVRIHNQSSFVLDQEFKPDRVRIIFHASESVLGTYSSDYQHDQFFGSQRILWNNKDDSIVLEDGMELQFTIQLPMVQFPPTVDIPDFYNCKFRLSAYIEGASRSSSQIAEDRPLLAEALLPIHYRPHIETRASKELGAGARQCYTLETMDKQKQKKFRVQLNQLEYIAGDTIEPLVHQAPSHRIHMQLFQEFTVNRSNHRVTSSPTKKKTFKRLVVDGVEDYPLLALPDDLIPSFSFGRMVSVSYKLRISFVNKESSGFMSSLKSSTVSLPDIPIQIGTLAYGLRPSDELQVYTAFKSTFDKKRNNEMTQDLPPLPVPKYVSAIEHNDALPLYEDYELPPYQEVF